jgi:hypothetical protein
MSLVLIAVSLAASAAQPKAPASLEAQLIARERASWVAWQKKDVAFWRRHLSADHVEIDGPGGPQDRNYVLKGVATRTCTVPRYKLGNFTFRRLGADAGMLVYKAEQEFACGDKRIPNTGWVTSIYARRDGRWENVLFEHYAVLPAKPAAAAKP